MVKQTPRFQKPFFFFFAVGAEREKTYLPKREIPEVRPGRQSEILLLYFQKFEFMVKSVIILESCQVRGTPSRSRIFFRPFAA